MSEQPEQQGLISDLGPIEIDWFQSIGYYGGIALAVAIGMIELPAAVFIASVPFMKMLKSPTAPLPVRAIADTLEGASKPVGGDGNAVIRIADRPPGSGSALFGNVTGRIGREAESIWRDARKVAAK